MTEWMNWTERDVLVFKNYICEDISVKRVIWFLMDDILRNYTTGKENRKTKLKKKKKQQEEETGNKKQNENAEDNARISSV